MSDSPKAKESEPADAGLSPLLSLLRCIDCGGSVAVSRLADVPGYPELGPDGVLACSSCGQSYPLIGGTPRMLPRSLRSKLAAQYPRAGIALSACTGAEETPSSEARVKDQTATSFAYEWHHFGELRDEWRRNFSEYLQPYPPTFFKGLLMLDVGTGSGRHSYEAARLGADVVAVDLGQSIDVARRNLPNSGSG
jgi:uncharacterized protein YbaR (Trm112 family)